MAFTTLLITKALNDAAPLMSNAPYVKFGIKAAFIVVPFVLENSDTSAKTAYETLESLVKDNSDALSVGVLTYVAAGAFALPTLPLATGAALVTDYAWTTYDKGTILTMPSSFEFVAEKTSDVIGMINQVFTEAVAA